MSNQEFETQSLGTKACKQSARVAVTTGSQRIFYTCCGQLVTAIICTIGLSFDSNLSTANATTLLQAPLFRVAEHAEFIFEGTVIKQSSQLSPQHSQTLNATDLPYTYFTFRINDIVKGSYAGKQIVLGFAGGTENGLTTKISDLHMPKTGERGVYFVESLDQKLLNPLYGWHQGHYIVHQQGNELTVTPLMDSRVRIQNPLAPQAIRAKTSLKAFKREVRHLYHSPLSS